MNQGYKKLFSHLKTPEPPAGLADRVIFRIGEEKKFRRAKTRLTIFSVGLVGSIVALVPAFRMLWSAFSQSGFFQFCSLFFSDFAVVMSSWQSFAFSLLETLPIMSLVIFFALIWVLLESLKFFTRNAKIFFKTYQLIHNN